MRSLFFPSEVVRECARLRTVAHACVVVLVTASLLTVAILFRPINVSAQPSPLPFSDLETTTPYLADILSLYQRGIVVGYPDGTFRPTQSISRAEFAKLVLAAGQCLDCQYPPVEIRSGYAERPFPDVPTSAWYYYCVAIAKRLGFVTGYLGGGQSGNYVPDSSISRAESIAVLLRASDIAPLNSRLFAFTDVVEGAWYEGYLQQAVNMGLIPMDDGAVRPEDKMSRAEFAHLANRVMGTRRCERLQTANPDEDGDGIANSDDACPASMGLTTNRGCPEGVDPAKVTDTSDIDGDGVLDRNDRCITLPGPASNQGCPNADTKDTDGDGVIDTNDRCPTVFGPASNQGCPFEDTDKDGVLDKDDRCPTVPGPEENGGCPWGDRDNDGVKDNVDHCLDIPGPASNQGCPLVDDVDGDGLNDDNDRCPTVPGPRENFGCPYPDNDWDGDTVLNDVDRCPWQFGLVTNRGCPPDVDPDKVIPDSDQDGDGTKDKDDQCIRIPGPQDNKGCPYPDTDGDGVLDKDDRCPTVPGPASNQGCPLDGNGNSNGNNGNTNGSGPLDRDNDGVPDDRDLCPDLPANLRNATPQNGCPFVTQPDPRNKGPIVVAECRTCPCPTMGDAAALTKGDVIYAAIMDALNSRIYGRSEGWVVR